MSSSWLLLLAGAPRLCAAAGPAQELPLSRKDAAWLAYVAAQPLSSSAALATLLWPEADARGALNNLRQRVHRLRRATGARLVEMIDTIALAADLAPQPAPGRTALVADPAAWDGELLGAFEYDDAPEFAAWLAAARRRRREARREALAAITSEAERDGHVARALVYAQRLVADDPLSEHAHRRLMRLHYLRGDNAAAVAAFEDCERVLKDELGLRPGAETLALLHTVEQARALPAAAPAPRALPVALLRPPRTVGRQYELQRLAEAARAGGVVLLTGEAGIGKTRLLQDHVAAAAPGTAVYAQARPGDAQVPFGTLQRLLQALEAGGGDAAVPTAPAALQALLAAAAARGVALLVVDDLHFADRASVEMLVAVTQAERAAPLCWVLAHRPPAAAEHDSPLLQVHAEAAHAVWLTLPPLDEAALGDLLLSLALPGFDAAEVVPALARHTGGNPLFAIETLRAAVAQGAAGGALLPRPQGLAHLLEQRLRRLSRPAMALARLAAVAVPDFSLALAEHVLGAPALALADAWQELEAAQVLRGEAFAHDLVHDAVRRGSPGVIAAHTHRQVAAFLAGRGVAPARLAHHWLQAGAPAEAAACLQQAAQHANAARRPREQAQLLLEAAAAHEAAGDAQAAWQARLDSVAPQLRAGGAASQAQALCEQLHDTAGDGPGAAPRRARARAMQALALMWDGRAADAETAARQAQALAEADDADVGVTAVSVLALSAATRGDGAAALALMQPWADRAALVREPLVRINFLGNYTNVLLQANRSAQALPVAQQHLAVARRHGHGGEQVTALMNLSGLHARRGELETAIGHAREADRLMPGADTAATLVHWNRSTLAFLLCGQGRFAEALDLFEAALAAFGGALPNPMLLAMTQDSAARAWLTLGQVARAQALLREPVVPPQGRHHARREGLRAELRRALGQPPEPHWPAVLQQLPPGDPVRIAAEITLTLDAPPEEALVQLAALQRLAEAGEYHPLAARAAVLRLPRLQALGRAEALARELPPARQAALRALGPHVYLPELMLHCAQAGTCLDRPAQAQADIDAALHWVHQMALPQVPPPFVESFLYRNPVNLSLQRLATARAG